MYTGDVIRLEDLENKDLYDIDHIYPQSLTADDSLDNRVLVKKQVNAAKSDRYPLAEEVRQKQKSFWEMLYHKGLISRTKYARLIGAPRSARTSWPPSSAVSSWRPGRAPRPRRRS